MRRFVPSAGPLLLSGGAAALAYGGYGAGVGRLGAGFGHWAMVAGVVAAGCLAFGAGLFRIARRDGAEEDGRGFADDLAAIERLAGTAARHPEGLDALLDLAEIVFEVRHRPPGGSQETLVERKGGAHV